MVTTPSQIKSFFFFLIIKEKYFRNAENFSLKVLEVSIERKQRLSTISDWILGILASSVVGRVTRWLVQTAEALGFAFDDRNTKEHYAPSSLAADRAGHC